MTAKKRKSGAALHRPQLIRQSLAFPFSEERLEELTAERLTALARANNSAVADVAVWLMQGKSVYTEHTVSRLAALPAAPTPAKGGERE